MARLSTPKLEDHGSRRRRRFHFSIWTIVAPVALAACVFVIVSIASDAGWTGRDHTETVVRTTGGGTSTQAGAAILYRVKKGETLMGIAVRFGISIESLRTLNPKLPRNGSLPAGRRIRLR
jgi:LysM repeat protein